MLGQWRNRQEGFESPSTVPVCKDLDSMKVDPFPDEAEWPGFKVAREQGPVD